MRSWALLAATVCSSVAVAAEPLTLERAVSLALTRNERVLAGGELARAAEARYFKARSWFFPTLSLTGAYTRQPATQFRPGDSLQATSAIQVTIFDGSVIPAWRAAAHDARAARWDEQDACRLVGFEAADAFLQTLGYEQVALAAQKRVALAQSSLEDAQVRFKAGLVSSNDVTRAEVELASAQRASTRADGDAQTSRLQLGYLIDSPVEGPLSPVDQVLPPTARPEEPPEALVRRAEQARPDVNAAQERILAANAAAEEPLWRFVPSLSASAQYRQSNVSSVLAPSQDWSAQVVLRWTLFDPARLADRSERLALAEVARLNESSLQRQAATQVQQALVALRVADAAVQEAEVATAAARRSAEETRVLYGQGLARAIEVSDATQRLFEAEVSLAQEQYARGAALLNLRSAVGRDPLGRELHP